MLTPAVIASVIILILASIPSAVEVPSAINEDCLYCTTIAVELSPFVV